MLRDEGDPKTNVDTHQCKRLVFLNSAVATTSMAELILFSAHHNLFQVRSRIR